MVATVSKSHKGGREKADYYGQPTVTAEPGIAAHLGITQDAQLTQQEVAHLLSGYRADGKHIAGKRHFTPSQNRKRVAFLDLAFSSTKSVSCAIELAPTPEERAAINEAFIKANEAMLRAALPLFGRTRGVDGERAEVAALTFHHDAARPTQAGTDPQRHAHNTILHTALTPSGKALTPNLSAVRGNLKAFGRIAHAHLENNLRQLGINAILDKDGHCHIPDVPLELQVEFSSRSRELTGKTPRARRHGVLNTRRGRDGPSNRTAWLERAFTIGVIMPSVITLPPQEPDRRAIERAERELRAPRQKKTRTVRAPSPDPVVAVGKKIELTKRVNAKYESGHGYFANAGHVVTIVRLNAESVDLQRADGKVGTVKWSTLLDKTGTVQIRTAEPQPKRRRVRTMDREDARLQFETELRARGLIVEGPAIMDGKWHRVRVDGDKANEKSGKYKGYLDGHPAGFTYNFRDSSQTRPWTASGKYEAPTAAERAKMEAERAQRESERLERVAKAEARARAIWANSEPVTDHAYLTRKGVEAFGAREDRYGNLIVAFRGEDYSIKNVQRIPAEPGANKLFVKDAPKTGRFGQIGRAVDGQPIAIGEGFATMASVYDLTDKRMPVRFAGDAGNLRAVAEITRRQFPNSPIVMIADNDHTLPRRTDIPPMMRRNMGIEKAADAAESVGNAVVVAPFFGAIEQGPLIKGKSYPSDYNDLVKEVGRATAQRELFARLEHEKIALPERPTQAQREEARTRTHTPEMTLEQRQVQQQAQQAQHQQHNRQREAT